MNNFFQCIVTIPWNNGKVRIFDMSKDGKVFKAFLFWKFTIALILELVVE